MSEQAQVKESVKSIKAERKRGLNVLSLAARVKILEDFVFRNTDISEED
uniref:Uncharacterized protein n=1 Tax=viral metagenome TaxID=1070528 RepID=A0A6M3LHU6_9ZZZZ